MTSLQVQSKMWTTPQAHDVTMRGAGQTPTAAAGNACLARDATNWSTPRASDGEKGGPNQSFGAGGIPLPSQAAKWPTPASRDYKGENSSDHLTNGTGRLHMDQLPNYVAHAFSHPAPEIGMLGGLPFWARRALLRALTDAGLFKRPRTVSRPYWPQTRRKASNPARAAWQAQASWQRWADKRAKHWSMRRLNPVFVEHLMGWPPGHALCDCSVMEFALWSQDMRSALSRLPTASGPWIWMPPVPTGPVPVQMNLL